MSAKPMSAPLSAQLTDRLLDLLSSDDAYRARFEHDPRAALVEIGYQSPEPAKMTACGAVPAVEPEPLIQCVVAQLASKDVIAQARQEIHMMLTSGLSQQAPKLDTGLNTVRRLRR
ncbi:NHLP-related RiPP peptide [Agrilutibacter solisilvae]|uniref:NHLP-related RiPP peptide n=1 Tax=Agrilutibacter solisilvae TaxID=2763317 RepID=A0A974Y097_9GAMM|nr:NHLP-related RiPP peptide [Lysobacter solisilvae]QSX79037.1 NHLP-related RiPP peptide [Lysobacter solisilvae]